MLPEEDEKRKMDNPRSDVDGESDDKKSSASDSVNQDSEDKSTTATPPAHPPLPAGEQPPPLPAEVPPAQQSDDGWEPVWDERAQAFYFFNRFTNATQWDNPRVSQAAEQPGPPGVSNYDTSAGTAPEAPPRRMGGYDPAIHGDFDPNADYAQAYQIPGAVETAPDVVSGTDPAAAYAATGTFNRFTGKWQRADLNPENFTDEQKSKRQMNAFFDVDAAANSHDGKSLRAERQNKKLSKAEVKAFKDKRREKKEEKRRAWLRD